ncbi:MAG: FAD:protein FMN transferase [Methylobacteriaceae bacterium]|jgi:thiamine biosynthesis lipoprotein|nr:FAD:protein FMN transferase [Methylobacteriaceae bacterium]
MDKSISRRRFIGIFAAGTGFAAASGQSEAGESPVCEWRGTALGAVVQMRVVHKDKAFSQTLLRRAESELRRLEAVFSLYQPDSAISRLNRFGCLAFPPPELVDLVQRVFRYSELTGGLFDPTIQPLWKLYAEHFAVPDADPEGPDRARVDAAMERVGLPHVAADRTRIVFTRKGMQLTLNGVAQGYITDKIVDLLGNAGVENSLVDMGEIRASGHNADGSPWSVGMENGGDVTALAVTNAAVATSGIRTFAFDAKGCFSHIFNPFTGRPEVGFESVSVVAPAAADADALSTAFALMDEQRVSMVLREYGKGSAYLSGKAGGTVVLGSA